MAGDVLGCDLYINGELFPDGREDDDFLSPLALDGLAITWGRETTVDQPEPSSCTFEVMDVPGGNAFLGNIFTGASVEVRSAVEVGGGGDDGQTQTLPDPTFSGTAVGATPTNALPELASTAVVIDAGSNRGHALDLAKVPGDTTNPSLARVSLAPGPITSGDPDAWADLPRVPDGSTWSYTLDLLAPPGAAVNVQGVYWYAPDGVGNGGAGSASVVNVVGTGEWEGVEHGPFVLTAPQPAWLGLWVRVTYTPWDQWPSSNGATWDEVPDGLTWDDLATTRVDNVNLYLYDAAPTNTLVMFAGAITDVEVAWDESLPPAGGARLKVTASDFTAQTNNFYVGDEPWPVEPMGTRFARVVTALNQGMNQGIGFGYVIAPSRAPIPLGYQDVDNQAAYGLLQGYAESVDGVLWPAVHLTYPRRYFYVEDINARASGIVLAQDPDTGWVVVDDSGQVGRTRLSSCYVLRDPVAFRQSTEDVTTRVAVGWEEQTLDEEGQPAPTQRTAELVNTVAEARLGVRRLQTSTLLTTEADAEDHAERKLRRLSSDAWRAEGVVWDLAIYETDDYPADVQETAADLLDGTTRIGLPLTLTDLPAWAPSGETLPVYVEGGTYTFTGGRWVLSLVVSNVYGAGSSASWDDLPGTWRWDDFGPDVTWNDLYGAEVAPTP